MSALDVFVQVLALLAGLRTRLGLAPLFISHDLPVVRSLCGRVVVLYLGRAMEDGPSKRLRVPDAVPDRGGAVCGGGARA